jgi:hypothetical protein
MQYHQRRERMRKILLSLVFLFCMMLFGSVYSYQNQEEANDQNDELGKILEKCAEYCEKLSNSVLFFVCMEKVTEEHFGSIFRPIISEGRREINKKMSKFYKDLAANPHASVRIKYLYDYQLIRKEGEVTEKRKLLEMDGEKQDQDNARLQTKFHHKNIIGGPIGLLSSFWQEYHDYRIVKEGKFKGDKVYIIEVTPKPDYNFNHLTGEIWVRKSDFSVMKLEWNQDGIEGYEMIKEKAKEYGLKPVITLTAEYAFEKNDIRFPSKYQIIEQYGPLIKRPRGRGRITYSKTMVEYKDYKFFTVETEVKY